MATRLQQGRPAAERFHVAVLWIEAFTAFTMPGRYIYFSRRLLQLCRHDEVAAFVIAHEIAHHDLGHFDTLVRWLPRVMGAGIANMLTVFFRSMEKVLLSSQKESDADRRAIDLCLQAGYDPQRCLLIFEILEKFALDVRAVDAALGPDDFDDEPAKTAAWRRRLRGAWYEIRRGYPPVRVRLQQLQCHLAERARQSV